MWPVVLRCVVDFFVVLVLLVASDDKPPTHRVLPLTRGRGCVFCELSIRFSGFAVPFSVQSSETLVFLFFAKVCGENLKMITRLRMIHCAPATADQGGEGLRDCVCVCVEVLEEPNGRKQSIIS